MGVLRNKDKFLKFQEIQGDKLTFFALDSISKQKMSFEVGEIAEVH